jgi:nicotinate-nucleotide adenylyltransferase
VRIGILGGTFDPFHNGHLIIASRAMEKLGLERLIFIPSHRTPLKDRPDITSPEHRWKMLEAAIEGKPGFEVSDIELYRPGPSYTIDTLRLLKGRFQPGDEVFFIMGWDSLNELPRWKQAPELVKLCTIAAFTRPRSRKPDLGKLAKEIPGLEGRVILLDIPPVDISSTGVREMVEKGENISGLVPAAVEKYIREHKLYSREKGKGGSGIR